MRAFALWLNSPVGQVIRDIVEGGIAGVLAAVVALQLDVDASSLGRTSRRRRPARSRDAKIRFADRACIALLTKTGPVPFAHTTVEQGTFDPLVPGSNPGRLTRGGLLRADAMS